MAIVAPLVVAGVAAYNGIKGAADKAAANKRARLNIRPTFDIQKEYFQNQSLAQDMAQNGLPDSAKNFYQTNAERGLGSSLGAILQTGGGINDVQKLYSTFDRNSQAVAAQDATQKLDNIRYLMKANNDLADQKTQQWAVNKYQPYLDEAKSIAAQKQQGQAEINSGVNGLASAVASYGAMKASEDNGGSSGSGSGPDGSTLSATNPNVLTTPSRYGPATLPNIQIPSTPDAQWDFDNASRQTAVASILNKYQNSPYSQQLSKYLQTA